MEPVISVELMRKSDEYTIKTEIPSKVLMYNAGKAVFEKACFKGNTAIVCGSGNNAGDGYVIALEMAKYSLNPTLVLLDNKFSPDGLHYFKKCKKAGIAYVFADENISFDNYDEICDCIFGTGFKGEPRGLTATIIDKINSSGKRVVSVDINSGLNGDTGEFEKCVRSDLTVSVGFLKTGFFLGKAASVIGKLVNADIGITLAEKGYFLAKPQDIAFPYTSVNFKPSANPVSELIKFAQGKYIKWNNIITNGENTYILRGDTNYEY